MGLVDTMRSRRMIMWALKSGARTSCGVLGVRLWSSKRGDQVVDSGHLHTVDDVNIQERRPLSARWMRKGALSPEDNMSYDEDVEEAEVSFLNGTPRVSEERALVAELVIYDKERDPKKELYDQMKRRRMKGLSRQRGYVRWKKTCKFGMRHVM